MQCRLKEILEEREIKQKWLAEKAGVSDATIRLLIKGSDPHLSLAYKIAKVLNLSIEDIWPPE